MSVYQCVVLFVFLTRPKHSEQFIYFFIVSFDTHCRNVSGVSEHVIEGISCDNYGGHSSVFKHETYGGPSVHYTTILLLLCLITS